MSRRFINPAEQAARTDGGRERRGEGRVPQGRTTERPKGGEVGTDRDVSPSAGAPTENGVAAEGRDEAGRFSKNNKGGPGNPFARQVAALRKAMLEGVTDEDMKEIMAKAVERAKQGDAQARKFVASYTIGKPATPPEPDKLDEEEWAYWKRTAPLMNEMQGMFKSILVETLLEMVREGRPSVSADLHRTIKQAMANPKSFMPQMPDLIMARSDKPLQRPRGSVVDLAAAAGAAAAAGQQAAVDPRGSEYLASGLEDAENAPIANGFSTEGRRRAWGLPPKANGGHGRKTNRKTDRPPSPTGNNGGARAERNGTPSANGRLMG